MAKYAAVQSSRKGDQLMSEGHYDHALEAYQEAIGYDANYAGPYNQIAWILAITSTELNQAQGYIDQAIAIAKRSGETNLATYYDTLGEVSMQRGHMLLNSNMPSEAAEAYRKAITAFAYCLNSDPSLNRSSVNYAPSYRSAMCSFNMQAYEQGKSELKRLFSEVAPHLITNPYVYGLKGLLYFNTSNYDEAIDALKQSLLLLPAWQFDIPVKNAPSSDVSAIIALRDRFQGETSLVIGAAYFFKGDVKESWKFASESHRLLPHEASPLYNLAVLSERKGDSEATVHDYLEQFVAQINAVSYPLIFRMISDPDMVKHRAWLARKLIAAGKVQSSDIPYFQDIISAKPTLTSATEQSAGNVGQNMIINIGVNHGQVIAEQSVTIVRQQVQQIFSQAASDIQQLPKPGDRKNAYDALNDLHQEVDRCLDQGQKYKPNARRIQKCLRALATVAPDVAQTVIGFLLNPPVGVLASIKLIHNVVAEYTRNAR